MKNLSALLFLSLLSITSYAQRYNDPRTANSKYEISLMSGNAANLKNDFVLFGEPGGAAYFNSIRIYRNFDRWQLGIGYNNELFKATANGDFSIPYHTPHLVFNRTQEGNVLSFYAGVMVGYSIYKYNYETVWVHANMLTKRALTGGGVVGGIQGGIIVKIYKFVSINGELAFNAREMKIKETDMEYTNYPYQTPVYLRTRNWQFSSSEFYMPFRIGLRFRF